MHIFRQISDLQVFLKDKNKIGFVPTMGFLHQGHLSLVKKSKQENLTSVVSIFVNPSQFNDPKDFEKYPRDEKRDLAMLEGVLKEGDCVFVPESEELEYGIWNMEYSIEKKYKIPVNLKNCMCGRTRQGHFEGVVEVVGRFLWIVNSPPTPLFPKKRGVRMYLGEKDYQQVKVLEDFVRKCFENVEVVECETVREKDGLAMSSRNVRLNENERKIAVNVYKEIFAAATDLKLHLVETGHDLSTPSAKQNLKMIQDDIIKNLQKFSEIKIDYIEIRDADDLREISDKTKNILIAGAIFLGDVRLIDNVVLLKHP